MKEQQIAYPSGGLQGIQQGSSYRGAEEQSLPGPGASGDPKTLVPHKRTPVL
jgi:hypothetical protein